MRPTTPHCHGPTEFLRYAEATSEDAAGVVTRVVSRVYHCPGCGAGLAVPELWAAVRMKKTDKVARAAKDVVPRRDEPRPGGGSQFTFPAARGHAR